MRNTIVGASDEDSKIAGNYDVEMCTAHLNIPTGGSAYGIPRKTAISFSVPSTVTFSSFPIIAPIFVSSFASSLFIINEKTG